MHEAAIATAMVEQALAAAGGHGLTRIREIEVEVGALRQVVPEALQLAFEACAMGTPAEGAALMLVAVPAEAVCRACGSAFSPALDPPDFACPRCHQADVRWTAGEDIILKSLVGEAESPDGE